MTITRYGDDDNDFYHGINQTRSSVLTLVYMQYIISYKQVLTSHNTYIYICRYVYISLRLGLPLIYARESV